MKPATHLFVPLLLLLVPAIACSSPKHRETKYEHKKLSFAVIGDSPYGDQNIPAFEHLVSDINSDRSVRFVMHAGDIKSGGEECTDERIEARFNLYQQFSKPFIYTPGDNEWTDCHRKNNGGYNPIERLQFLRQVFYPKPNRSSGGYPMRLDTQANDSGFEEYVENTMFSRSGVVFSSIHVVGSNNNLKPWAGIDENDSFLEPRSDRMEEFQSRESASIEWLEKTFTKAENRKSKGVFIMIHANPLFATDHSEDERQGFNNFLDRLFTLAKAYEKPVLIAHGDSHVFFVDRPKLVPWYADGSVTSADEKQVAVPNLIRLQTFGDNPQHWIKVTIDDNRESLFDIEAQVVKNNL